MPPVAVDVAACLEPLLYPVCVCVCVCARAVSPGRGRGRVIWKKMYVNPFPNKWAWLHGNRERCHKRPACIMPTWIKTSRLLNVTTQACVWIAHVTRGRISSTTVADPNSKAPFWSWESLIIIIDALKLQLASRAQPVIHVCSVCVMETQQHNIMHAKPTSPNTGVLKCGLRTNGGPVEAYKGPYKCACKF